MSKVIGVDIGGSHISAGILSDDGMSIADTDLARGPVNSAGSREEILDAWSRCILALEIEADSRLGIAMPAPFDYENGISLMVTQGKYQALYRSDIRAALAERLCLPTKNVTFMNDAAAFLQGEAHVAGWPASVNLMGITLGTGLGGAFKSGHLAEDGAIWCIPFKGGIAEDLLSTAYFTRWARTEFGKEVEGLKDLLNDPQTRAETLSRLKDFAGNLADLILMLQDSRQSDIDKVVFGGNILKAEVYFLPLVREILQQKGFMAELHISKLGEKAAMIGASSVCIQT
ncbi:glucokinase [Cyclobacterium lianum]|uniref:Glucokinase n=1 Tax=Cyclobacterium lianum TaxID=388280 RepID=A0A1M7PW30_9BACT|nr:ROK family protein [Cyclobacterium lianum]SHN21818.1 glucokinase [Cyclobacterium lianum]